MTCTATGILTMKSTERQYVKWTIQGLDSSATIQISADGGTAVDPDAWDGSVLRILIAGADTDEGDEQMRLAVGTHQLVAVITDTPELLMPDLGLIEVR